MTQRITSFVLISAALVSHANADVRVVSPLGPYTQIQEAISAAQNGDVVLVKSGTYKQIQVSNKSITIVADTGATVIVDERISIFGTAGAVLLSGLTATGVDAGGKTLIIDHCAGPVRIQDCVIPGSLHPGTCAYSEAGAFVLDSPDVAFTGCTISGGVTNERNNHFKPAMRVSNARIVFSDCSVTGGLGGNVSCSGTAGFGGVGDYAIISSDATEVWMSSTATQGGSGGAGANGGAGGAGGDALLLFPNSSAHQIGSSVVGGGGGVPLGVAGNPYNSYPGASVVNHAGAARVFTADTVVRASTSLALTFDGVGGDRVALYANSVAGWTVDPLTNWVRSIGTTPTARFLRYGSLPGAGSLSVTVPVGPIAPGVQATVVHLQSSHRELGGALYLGSPRFVVVLDPSF